MKFSRENEVTMMKGNSILVAGETHDLLIWPLPKCREVALQN